MNTSQDFLRPYILKLADAGVPDSRLDAQCLLSHVLDIPRSELLARPELIPDEEQIRQLGSLIDKRSQRIPLQHLTGSREFYGRTFRVTAHTLVPRPDTECLIERVLEKSDTLPNGPILDLGTGTGAIGVTLHLELDRVPTWLADISSDALAIANENAAVLGADVRIALGNWDEAVPRDLQFALVVSNPPYITDDEWVALEPEVRDFEPEIALRCGKKPLEPYHELLNVARRRLVDGGIFMCEIGPAQADWFLSLADGTTDAAAHGFGDWHVGKDLGGRDRVVSAVRNRTA